MTNATLRNRDVNAALNEAKEAYVTSAPASLARYVEATTPMPVAIPAGAALCTVPPGITRAQGCRMWDADGREFIDFLGDTPPAYGHCIR